MRKFYSRLLAVVFLSGVSFIAQAQIDVTASGGTPNATYTTLKLAFDAINAGTHTGTITIAVTGNTTETAPAVLNASGAGSASYTSIGISPSGGAARTISGAIAAGSPLLDLNGADNVTINGLNSGGNTLTIANTTASTTSGTATIRFILDATNNTITNCNIQGSANMTSGTNGGVIFFSTFLTGGTGNDNNTISFCNIGPAGANLPSKCIYGNGTTTAVANYNSGNTISNNNIFDFFLPASQSNGILLSGGNTDWTISNNKFYQTATRTQTTGAVHAPIQLGSANINNCTISGNTIGYSSSAGTGTYTFVGLASSRFYPIYLSSHGTTTATVIQNNTVKNISMTGAASGTSSSSPFIGIFISSGLANATGNTVGDQASTGNMVFNFSSTSTGEVYGIYNFSSSSTVISNNNIGGFTISSSSTGSGVFYGIRSNTSSTAGVTADISNNIIGGTVAGSITNTNAGTSSRVIGILHELSTPTINGNTVRNMTMLAANTGTSASASVLGISQTATGNSGYTVSNNLVHSLSNTNSSAAVNVVGIRYTGPTTGTNLISKNIVHSLNNASSSATADLRGILVAGGTSRYDNNMVRLGIDEAGASISGGISVYGIYDNNTVATGNAYLFNTVYVGGTGVGGTANTWAFSSDGTINTRDIRNNIFHNARSNGAGTGVHYGIQLGGVGPSPTGLTSNYNNLRASGTGGVLGFYDGANRINIGAWAAATGQDAASVEETPTYLNATGTAATVNLKINTVTPTFLESGGIAIAGITTDFENDVRAATPDIGADEFAGTAPTCSGTPAASNALISPTPPLCNGSPFTLSLSTSYVAVDYQWQSSPDNSTWTNIPGAIFSTHIATGYTSATYFRAVITCPASGLSTNSASVQATFVTPLNGVYTINNTNPTGGTNYNNFLDAVNDLNCKGISGDVTFNVSAGQTFLLTDSLNILATGTAADTIAFVKSGAGANPKLQRLGNGGTANYILRIGGGDYFTFNGLDFEQTGTSATDWVETGILLQNSSATNGAQHNTFLNGVISITDANAASKGVHVQNDLTPTAASGNNSYNRFLNMTVQNSYEGYRFQGSTTSFPDIGNEINNLTGGTSLIQNLGNATVTGSLYGVIATYQAEFRVKNTEIMDLDPGGTSLAYGIALQTSAANSAEFATNHIHDITGGGTVNGINITSADSVVVYGNLIHALSTTGTAATLRGIDLGGTGLGISVFSNFIYDLSSSGITGTTVGGIDIGTGDVYNVFNNMISDLRAPASTSTAGGTKGIVISSGSTGNIVRLYYNTVVLSDIGAVASYTSAGIYNSSTTPTLDIRNNIIINNSNVTTGTRAVAFWKTSTTDNVATTSNNNLYYAGTPGAKNLIYYNGTTSAQTLAAYQALAEIAPGETFSVTENVSFLPPVFGQLRPNPAVPTLVESGGQPLPPLTYDFELNPRGPYPMAGQVNGGGFAPDLGADEGDFIYIAPPLPNCATLVSPTNGETGVCPYSTITLNWTPAATGGAPSLGFDVYFGTSATPPLVTNTFSTSYTPTGILPNTTYYWQIVPKNQTGSASGCVIYSFTTTNVGIVTTTPDARCGTGTLTLGATGNGTLNWYDQASGGSIVGTGTSFITPSLSATTNYWVSASSGSAPENVASPTIGTSTFFSAATGWGLRFTVNSPVTINSVKIKAMNSAAGPASMQIKVTDLTDVVLYNGTLHNFNITTSLAEYVIPVNITIPTPGNYKMVMTSTGITDLVRESGGVTFPYNAPSGAVSITAGANGTGTSQTTSAYYWFYNWIISIGCESPRVQVTATVNEIPTITLGTNPSICSGTVTANLPYSAVTGSPDQYSIDFDVAAEAQGFVDVVNAALPASPIVITVPGAAAGGVYNATLTVRNSGTTCVSAGSPITVTVTASATPTVSISANPAGPVCAGTSVEFTANASGTGGGTVTYDFKVNGLSVQMGASNTYTSTTLANGDQVKVDISISGGSPCLTATTASSGTITMSVSANETPSVSLAVLPGTTICSGTSTTFTATASGTGGGTVTYAFKVNGSTVQSGASNSYVTTTLANGDAVTVDISIAGGTCLTGTTASSNTINMTVNPSSTPTVVLTANPSGPICVGTSVTFTATASGLGGGTVSTYNFWKNGISVQTGLSNTYTTSALANGDNLSVDIFVSGGTCLTTTGNSSNIITMTVLSSITPTVTLAAVPAGPVCAGTSVQFTATASSTGGGTVSYDFKVNGSSVQNGASNTYTTSSLANNDQVVVDISISGGSACLSSTTATSNTITMTVNPNLTPTVTLSANPGGAICAGTSVQFTATAGSTGGGTVAYNFKVNGSSVQNGASNTYTTTTLANGDQVTVEITISGGTCLTSTTATSNTIMMTVNPTSTPTVVLTANPPGAICAGTSVTFTATASGLGGGTVSTYNFWVNGISVQTGLSNTYTTSTLANGDNIAVDIFVEGGTCLTTTGNSSNIITMTVNPTVTPTVTLAANPAGSICAGTSVQFTATASNTGGGTVSYDFRVNGSSVQTGASNTYTSSTLANGDAVSVVINITGGSCITASTATSNTINMVVTPGNTPTVTLAANPAGAICAGTSVQFTATANNTGGGTVAYNFKVNGSSVQNGASNTYTTTTLANGNTVTVEITITGGTCLSTTTATSNTITMVVNPGATPTVSIAANPSGPICAGTSVQFTATANNTGGGTVAYNFKVNGTSVQNGASNTYTTTTLANGNTVTVEITITGGTCLSTTTATSNTITMVVNPNLTPTVALAANPAGPICAGTSVQFTATANNTGGGTVAYNFKVNGTSVQNGASNTYTTTTLANGNTVTVEITITGGTCLSTNTATSNTITMVVNPNLTPTVTLAANPAGAICAGTSVQFTATANNTGGGTVAYNFKVNGTSVQNGASNTYTTTTLANGNTVTVEITITGGTCLTATTATSNTITMVVNPNLTPTVTLAANPTGAICAGTSVQFTASASNTGGGTVSYDFKVNGTSVQTGASNTYTTTTLANGNTVTVEITITGGACLSAATATSNTITMLVTPAITPTLTVAAVPGNNICAGTSVQFTATAANTGGGTVNYNFRVNGTSVQNGASNTWTSTTLANGDNVTVVITITGGSVCLTTTTLTSTPITMTVRAVPTVGLSASPLTSLLPGQTTTLTATPSASTGGTVTTTWMYNGVAGVPGILVGNTFVANVEDIGSYQVLIQETFTSPALVCSNQSPVVNITATASSRLFIFPSPNDGRFTVSYYNSGGTSSKRTIAIFDQKGSMVFKRDFSITGPYTLIPIDMQHASTGIYYLVVSDSKGTKLADGKVHIR